MQDICPVFACKNLAGTKGACGHAALLVINGALCDHAALLLLTSARSKAVSSRQQTLQCKQQHADDQVPEPHKSVSLSLHHVSPFIICAASARHTDSFGAHRQQCRRVGQLDT